MKEKNCNYDENVDEYDTPSLIPTKDRDIKLTKSTVKDLYGGKHHLSVLPNWAETLIRQLLEDREYYKGFPLQIDAMEGTEVIFPNNIRTPIYMSCGDRLALYKPLGINEATFKIKWKGRAKSITI
jgi:hypothetical protein